MPQVVVEGAKRSLSFFLASHLSCSETGADYQLLSVDNSHQLFMWCRRSSTHVCYKRAEHTPELPEQAEL